MIRSITVACGISYKSHHYASVSGAGAIRTTLMLQSATEADWSLSGVDHLIGKAGIKASMSSIAVPKDLDAGSYGIRGRLHRFPV